MTKHYVIQATQNDPMPDGSRGIRYYTGANGDYQWMTSKAQAQKFEQEETARDAIRNYQLRVAGFVVCVVPMFGVQS